MKSATRFTSPPPAKSQSGMKSYYRYRPSEVVGVITTPDCKAVYDHTGKLVFTSKIQEVGVWNVRQGNLVKSLSYEDNNYPYAPRGEVSTLTRSGDQKSVCVGYTTGEVRVYNYITGAITATFRGHRSAVNVIALDGVNQDGTLLATGGADCDIVVWDQVASQGLVRFREHKDAVTGLAFLDVDDRKFLISVSKDTLLKVWDVENKYCLQTIVGHRSEIWSLAISYQPADQSDLVRVFTGAGDEKIRAYALKHKVLSADGNAPIDEDQLLVYVGSVGRTSNAGGHVDRCASLAVDSSSGLLAAQSAGKIVDIFRIRSKDESKKKTKKRRKRLQEQLEAKSSQSGVKRDADGIALDDPADLQAHDDTHGPILTEWQLVDELESLHTLRTAVKMRSFEFSPAVLAATDDSVTAMVALSNNSIEAYKIPLVKTPAGVVKSSVVDFAGHRNDLRGLCVSQDGNAVATCSSESIKVWNARSMQCTGTCIMPTATQYCLCIAFAPGGRYIIAGFKDGSIQIFDTASGDSVYSFTADQLPDHEGGNDAKSASGANAVYAIAVRPDGTGFVAGGADKTARFFRFLLGSGSSGVGTGVLQAQCTREMSLPSELLSVKYSHHKGKATGESSTRSPLLVAMALLDHTVRILYDDTLRLCLTLYGHSLPVMCLDIASDNMLVVTGSADKTLKLWGLDFGDCHRSLFGHSDTVTTVQFVAFSHYFFSGSKDGSIRYWDGDRFEQVLYLPGHKGTVWSLGVGLEGAFVFSVGQDRSLRRWMRDTDDLVFVEEEKERALEAQVDQQALAVQSSNSGMVVMLEKDGAAPRDAPATTGATSLIALKGGDLLMQTLDLLEEHVPLPSLESLHVAPDYIGSTREVEIPDLPEVVTTPHSNPMFLSLSPLKYFQRCVTTQIPRADLEASLMVLPMTYVISFLCWLEMMVLHGGVELETSARCLVTLLLCHQRSLSSQSSVLLPHMLRLRQVLTRRMDAYKSMIGMNQAAFRFVQQSIETQEEEKQAITAVFSDPSPSTSHKKRKH